MERLSLIVRILLMAVCVAPLIVSPLTWHPLVIGKALYARTIIEIAFCLWVVLIIYRPEHRPRHSWLLVALLAFLAISFLSSFFGVNVNRSLWSSYERMVGVVNLAHWSVWALMLSAMFRTERHWKQLLGCVVVVATLVALMGIAEVVDPDGPFAQWNGSQVTSTLANSLVLGTYACVIIGFAAILMYLHRRRFVYLILSGAILLNLAVLWLSASRSGLLYLLVAVTIFGVLSFLVLRGWRARLIALTAVLPGLALVMLVAWLLIAKPEISDPRLHILHRIQWSVSHNHGLGGRFAAAEVAIRAWGERPLLGYGPGNFEIPWGLHAHDHPVEAAQEYFDDAHNVYLEAAATSGTLGFVSFVTLCALLLWMSLRGLFRIRGPDALIVVAVACTVIVWLLLGIAVTASNVHYMFFFILIAWVVYRETADRAPLLADRKVTSTRWRTVAVMGVTTALVVFALVLNLNLRISAGLLFPSRNIVAATIRSHEIASMFPPLYTNRQLLYWGRFTRSVGGGTDVTELPTVAPILAHNVDRALAKQPVDWKVRREAAWMYLSLAIHDPAFRQPGELMLKQLEPLSPFYAENLRQEADLRRSGGATGLPSTIVPDR